MEFKQQEGIHDARQLGYTKFTILGIQHLFAMFGATILVPALTGLSVSTTLFFAGIGTLLFHFVSKRMVPDFLGSSFAFIGSIHLSGLAIAALVGVVLNAILPEQLGMKVNSFNGKEKKDIKNNI